MTALPKLNQEKIDQFGMHMVQALNGAAVALMASIGHQLGLFDTMADMPPATSQQIASAARLHERYVREWLASLAAARVIEYDPNAQTFRLPPEHATLLTRAAGPNNIARGAQIVAFLAGVESQVVASFRQGGGVPYSAFPTFHKLMAELSIDSHTTLVEARLPLIPGLITQLERGIDVADIGCGQGHAITILAKAFPRSRCTGYDISAEAIEVGRADAARMQLSNARFEACDVTQLGVSESFDFITAFDTIHDVPQPGASLRAIAAALRPGGIFFMVENAAASQLEDNLAQPMGPWKYAISCMHCLTISLASDGVGLGMMWGKEHAIQMLYDAGFSHVEVKQIEPDYDTNYYIATKASSMAISI